MKVIGGMLVAAFAALTVLAPRVAHAVDDGRGVQLAQAATKPVAPPARPRDLSGADGQAVWYGARLHGRRTASGQRFNMNALTAAHATLPFGSRVRVTNLRTGRSVVVRINDRLNNRNVVVDVSRAAARQLGMVRAGHAPVKLAVVLRPAPKKAKVAAKAKAPAKKKIAKAKKPAAPARRA